jgi:DNA topoisomerase-1
MALAQRLFEGVELGDEGPVGLLTYVRTDSVRLAPEAVEALRAHAAGAHGASAVPRTPNRHAGRPRAQAAHEAIRPTSTEWPPERVRPLLTGAGARDLARLYALVFERAVASQMAPAQVEEVELEVEARLDGGRRAVLRAEARSLVAPGWWAASSDGGGPEAPRGPWAAAVLAAGTPVALRGAEVVERPTPPPARFDEASLVEELDERGLGRPSTFAAIVDAIQARGYVERDGRALRPTPLGVAVAGVLGEALPRELDPAFTAAVEERLDRVEAGREGWREVLAWFHAPFREALSRAEAAARAPAGAGTCERCGAPMAPRWGRHGRFLACTAWPACRFTREVEGPSPPGAGEGEAAGEACPDCGGAMVLKRGRFGRFLACARYPACRGKRPVSTGVACPRGCGGVLTERRSRQGRVFYGCSTWPGCDVVTFDRPLPGPCPRCGHPYLVERRTAAGALAVACPSRGCDHRATARGGSGSP